MKIDLYTQSGEKKGQVDANDKIFGIEPNEKLVHQALVRQLANARQSAAHTKTRGEIVGSTRKIYRQKGTGGARHGARYANIFRGGGVVFGPTSDKNYTKQMPRKQRRVALFSALSVKAKENNVIALEKYEADAPKTKDAAALIAKLPIKKNALIVEGDQNVSLEKSMSNLPNTKVIRVNYLNPSDLLKFETVVFLADALTKAEEIFLKA